MRRREFTTRVRRVDVLATAVRFVLGACSPGKKERHEEPGVGIWHVLVLVGGPLAVPLAGMSAVGLLALLLVVAGCSGVRYLRGLAWEDVGRVAPAAHPAPFVLR